MCICMCECEWMLERVSILINHKYSNIHFMHFVLVKMKWGWGTGEDEVEEEHIPPDDVWRNVLV